jgi:hypothetical protein
MHHVFLHIQHAKLVAKHVASNCAMEKRLAFFRKKREESSTKKLQEVKFKFFELQREDGLARRRPDHHRWLRRRRPALQ